MSFSPSSIRILVFAGILPIVDTFGVKLRNELEYAGQPSRLIHVPLAVTSAVLPDATDFDASKNDIEFSIRVGFSSVSIFMRVSLLISYSNLVQ